ncbi:hypothetical protein NONI108955_33750 [Nocardia ninae]|uniref:hypothetical protein n=1 Tax=Nocardia ninae TaxID=356145 RepID=UPI00164993B6|nr:hypothetical protein [Nocardia ninae]
MTDTTHPAPVAPAVPEQFAGLVQGNLDDTLPGRSFGVSGMTALRPGTGPTIRVQ